MKSTKSEALVKQKYEDQALLALHEQLFDSYLTPRLQVLSENLYEQLFQALIKKIYLVTIKVSQKI